MTNIKLNIQKSIRAFNSGKFRQNAEALFAALGYKSEKTFELENNTPTTFLQEFDPNEIVNTKKAKPSEWLSVDFLFQLTDEELNQYVTLFSVNELNREEFISYVFIAIELKEEKHTRTTLSNITREVNRLFKMPAFVLFKHGNFLTLSIIDRRPNKKYESRDVLEKVTLIKDIRIPKNNKEFTNRGQIEILYDLHLDQLKNKRLVKNFNDLHKSYQKVLNISELNKTFFNKLLHWYLWAMKREDVQFNYSYEDKSELIKKKANYLIKILTRLMFIWFLKEKGLVSEELFQFDKLKADLLNQFEENDSSYYIAILQNLFFNTLNEKIEHRFEKFDTNYLRHFKDRDLLLKLFNQSPFVNGGLFDFNPAERNNQNPSLCKLSLPNDLFFTFGKRLKSDLSEELDSRKADNTEITPLIDLLHSYKFTFEEHTPIEQEVALDPELLGKTFENLLASHNEETKSTARKATGSFYTPREIVDYMVEESLINYLSNKIFDNPLLQKKAAQQAETNSKAQVQKTKPPDLFTYADNTVSTLSVAEEQEVAYIQQSKDQFKSHLRQLLQYDLSEEQLPSLNNVQKEKIIQALDSLTILDPAVGSGAFPMGILQKTTLLLQRIDPQNKKWLKIVLSRVSRTYRKMLEKKLRGESLDYTRKLGIIQQSIYGIDIQPIAVQIAKLRFFISLVIEQKTNNNPKDNFGIMPLPNLEFKMVCADTLLDVPMFTRIDETPSLKESLNSLAENIYNYFSAENNEKKKLQKKIKQNLTNIQDFQTNIIVKISRKNDKSQRSIDRGNLLNIQDRKSQRSEKVKIEKRKADAKMYAQAIEQWDSYDNLFKDEKVDFFNTRYFFPNVKEGFDIVIGNPPYIQIQKFSGQDIQKNWERQGYQTFIKTGDVYCLFYERGTQLLKEGGILCYITSNKWMKASYGKKLRKYFINYTNPFQLIDFGGHQVFETPTVDVNILLFKKENYQKQLQACKMDNDYSTKAMNLHNYFAENYTSIKNLSENTWIIVNKQQALIKEHIEKQGVKLNDRSWNISINYGVKTGMNDAFIIDNTIRKNLINKNSKNHEIIKPLLRGKDIKPYDVKYENLWLIFTRRGINIEEYPTIKEYLKTYYDDLKPKTSRNQKRGRKPGSYKWYEIQDNIAYFRDFEKPKIIYPNMTKYLPFYYDDNVHFFTNDKTFILTGKSLKFLVAVFNSKLFKYCFRENFPELQGGTRELRKVFFQEIPIKQIPYKEQEPFNRIVDYIQFLKKQPNLSKSQAFIPFYLEQVIDGMVYELYFEKELKNANRDVLQYLTTDKNEAKPVTITYLPPINKLTSDSEKLQIIEKVYQELYHLEHPIRNNLFYMNSIEVIKTIEDAELNAHSNAD